MAPLTLSPIANHLWQSTLFAAFVLLLTLVSRRNRAHVRYWLWLAASAKFLVPFSLLVTLGNQFEWRARPVVEAPLSSTFGQIAQPFAQPPMPATAMPAAAVVSPVVSTLLVALWIVGCTTLLAFWWMRWWRIRLAMRTASPLAIHAPIEVMSSLTRLEPGVFGVFRPVLVLPEGIAERLPPTQLRSILMHELCHVRRRDNLTSAFHMVVEAIFWFHPLVWWIGARLIEERERACDEAVLSAGAEPQAYAAGILNVCKLCLGSPLPCASGVTGADLKKRIEEIMSQRILHGLSLGRKLLLSAAGIAAVAGPIVIGIANAPQSRAQAPADPALKFEVATIKPARGDGGRGGLEILPGGGLRMSGITLRGLIAFAYDLRETQISGGPAWANSEVYAIVAKPEHSEAADNSPHTVTAWNRVRLRTQDLLAERFHLVLRKNAKEEAAFALVVAKSGTKLTPSPDQGPPGTMRSKGQINARRGTMPMLATVLSEWLRRPVVDRTGLTGNYDYKLEYSPEADGPMGPSSELPDVAGVSVFTALQEQLGLRLESTKAPIENIVIESADRPSAN